MEKKIYKQPFIKVLSAPYLLDQEFEFGSGGGNAGGAAAKRNAFYDDSESEDNLWNYNW